MAKRTKKLGVIATYGARYGRRVRNKAKIVIESSRKKYDCPRCAYNSVVKVSTGIWHCKHCDYHFTGGAFQPRTDFMKSKSLMFKRIDDLENE